MRRLVSLLLVTILLTGTVVFAGEVEDLQKERQELSERMMQYQQTMQNIRDRLIEVNAILNYIQSKSAIRVGTEGDLNVE